MRACCSQQNTYLSTVVMVVLGYTWHAFPFISFYLFFSHPVCKSSKSPYTSSSLSSSPAPSAPPAPQSPVTNLKAKQPTQKFNTPTAHTHTQSNQGCVRKRACNYGTGWVCGLCVGCTSTTRGNADCLRIGKPPAIAAVDNNERKPTSQKKRVYIERALYKFGKAIREAPPV